MPTVDPSLTMLAQCRAYLLPHPVPELRWHPKRKWRWDWAWPDCLIAIEVQGGTWTGGKHGRGAGLAKDRDKLNHAALMGWTVLTYTPREMSSGAWITQWCDAFDLWVVKLAPFLAEDRITIPAHLRGVK